MSVSYLEADPDVLFMRMAIVEARRAATLGEVPVGVIIVHPDHGVIAKAHNERERLRDPTAHAEMLAIGQAAAALDAWRLSGTTMYSTLEPCPMCAGALIQARITRCVFGASDPKAGAVESVCDLWHPGIFNHDVEWRGGVLAEECGAILRAFFRERRPSQGTPAEGMTPREERRDDA